MSGYGYNWRAGLEISTPAGQCFVQGDNANRIFDELEELPEESVEFYLDQFSTICE